MQAVTVLGSTGSIGRNTLDVLQRHPDRYRIQALAAGSDAETLHEQCLRYKPAQVALADEKAAKQLAVALAESKLSIEVLAGSQAITELAADSGSTIVMAAIVGAAGLPSALAAVQAGKRVLLANKEALVMAGQVFIDAVAKHNACLLPVDSEHNAVFQCLPPTPDHNVHTAGVKRIILTASGGPFREWTAEQLAAATPEQACAHPNWSMGRKISVDSATLMNKGLELVEAHWLFGLPAKQLDAVIHPQSTIHSLVEYADGSYLAQLGMPDMRTPIACALAWPERIDSGVAALNFMALNDLQFSAPDTQRFPCLALALQALDAGGAAVTQLNAANEIAVQAFLEQRISFMQIPEVVEETLECSPNQAAGGDLAAVVAIDNTARAVAEKHVARLG